VLVLTDAEVAGLLDRQQLRDALRHAFIAISDGSASVPARVAALAPAGLLGAMPGFVPGYGLGAKLVSYFRTNEAKGLPGHQAVILLVDPDDGRPLALLGGTHITAVRTANAAAVAAQALAPASAASVAVVGTGVQGRAHLDAFADVFPDAKLVVAGRRLDPAEALVDASERATAAESIEAAVRAADVVCLCTDADDPVIERTWLRTGAHVSSVGSGFELDPATVAAGTVFVESRAVATQPFPAGSRELHGLDPESLTELGEVLLSRRSGRRRADELTVYKSMGHASQDVVAGCVALRAATERGVGTGITI
jgi:alanine dehydrogenase